MFCTESEFNDAVSAYASSTFANASLSVGARIEVALSMLSGALGLLPEPDQRVVLSEAMDSLRDKHFAPDIARAA
ncbi:hypothetical protein [Acidiphilium angustum]|uniref:hypothetical protein n=1 Tax=Acidiphilium angustum TaxID=523 RepID=UPI000494468F|nr:hypothetical protein [Acidiphilium angustum]